MSKLLAIAFLLAPFAVAASPHWFEPNLGQTNEAVEFLGPSVYLGASKVAIRATHQTVVMTLAGVNHNARGEALDQLRGVSNWYVGNDPTKWRSGIRHYARVRYRDVYPGIDQVFYYNTLGQLEFDFLVAPGADPRAIQLSYNYPVRTDSEGNLLIANARLDRPKVYQDGREIACKYIVRSDQPVRLALSTYDRAQSLMIDPTIVYSTYLGGNAQNVADAIAVDASGSAYVTGSLESPSYPDLNPFQQTSSTSQLVVLAKFLPDGQALQYYTYVGGTGQNYSWAIAIDASGGAYAAGDTTSTNFPVLNAAQPVFGGGFSNAFIFKLTPTGQLGYSTYLGGSNQDQANGLAVDPSGAAFVAGYTYSTDFPVKKALQATMTGRPDAFVAKLSPDGSQFEFATYLGGNSSDYGKGIALDSSGNPVVVGSTSSTDFPVLSPLQASLGGPIIFSSAGFITRISSAGDKILYSSYFGPGTAYIGLEDVALDGSGNILVSGEASGPGLAVVNPVQSSYGGGQSELVIAKLDPQGSSALFTTYFGGSNADYNRGLATDPAGNLYVTGFTYSTDFPVKDSIQSFGNKTQSFKDDVYLVKLSPAGSLIYSTLIGGDGDDRASSVALDPQGAIYLAGSTSSDNFPLKNPLQSTYGTGSEDMFIMKLAPDVAPPSLSATPAILSFSYTVGGPLPASQQVTVSSSAGASSFTPSSNATWLTFTASGNYTPATLTISVNPSALTPGNYPGTIQIDSQTSIQVTLNVLAAAPNVTSAAPATIAAGSSTTIVTITGTGFESGAVVQLNGTSLPTVFVNSTTLQFTLVQSYLAQPTTLSLTVMNPQSAPSTPITLVVGVPAPQFTAASVVNAASYSKGAVAPGEIVTIFGSNFGTMGNTQVLFGSHAATLVFVNSTQVSATVPYSVAGTPQISLTISSNGLASAPVTLAVAPSSPAIFTADSSGKGQASAEDADYSINGPAHPATLGSFVALYGTGGGPLTTDTPPRLMLPVSATVGGLPAQVFYAGIAPGLVQGVMQINVAVPSAVVPGPSVPVVVTVDNAISNTVTIAINQ
jgi:uncharacterized protein (TIGR03437 family)